MARREVRESAHDEQWGWREMQRLFEELEALPDHQPMPIEPGSLFDVDGKVQNYDRPADQMLFLMGVAIDHLGTFRRMLQDPDGGLPTFAGYTLMRAAIEASATAVWLRCAGTTNARVGRSLWLMVNNRSEVQTLASRLGLAHPEGHARMLARANGIIEGRRGLHPGVLTRHHTKTSILNEADRHVPRGVMSSLEVWQACSGLTHSNRSSAVMFLERQELETEGTRGTYLVTASARITAEMLSVTMSCLQTASRLYIEHLKA